MYLCAKIKSIFDGTLVAVIIADDSGSYAQVMKSNVVIVGAVISWYQCRVKKGKLIPLFFFIYMGAWIMNQI